MKQNQNSFKNEDDENAFLSFFSEMNDKAHEAISKKQPEPERALEFLKKAENFLKMIEKSTLMKTARRSERDPECQCIQTSFLNIKVDDEEQDNLDGSPLLRES